jgi:serine/threonine protein kinase
MGVVHRDIKLENVLYENHSQQATVRLIDFGLSRTFDRTAVAADYTRTPYTLSPETAASMEAGGVTKLTPKTDVWAVGVIAFVMLSGEFPFIKTNLDLEVGRRGAWVDAVDLCLDLDSCCVLLSLHRSVQDKDKMNNLKKVSAARCVSSEKSLNLASLLGWLLRT